MPTINFTTSFNNPKNANNLPLISTAEFKELMLAGIPLCGKNGENLATSDSIQLQIQAAREFIEKQFSIKIRKQIIDESKDYMYQDFASSGFIKTTFPVNKVYKLTGNLANNPIVTYPVEWVSLKKNSDGTAFRNMYLIPNGLGNIATTQQYWTSNMFIGLVGMTRIPNYWGIVYCTGYDRIPRDLLNFVLKLAAISTLLNIELGINSGSNPASFGVATSSLSLDGMSQSISKMNGGSIFQQRIKQYWTEFNSLFPMIKNIYSSITFDCA